MIDIKKNTEIETQKGLSNFWFILIFILTAFTFIYLFKCRTINDIIRYTLYISIPLNCLVITIYFWIKRESKKQNIITLFFILLIVTFASMSYYALAISIKGMYMWFLSPIFTKNTAIILIILVTLLLGLFFFYFRLRFRSIYGLTESIFGLLIAGNKITTQSNLDILNSDFFIPFLTASVYLVVRGFDNIHQGLTKDPIDPIAKKILDFLRQS